MDELGHAGMSRGAIAVSASTRPRARTSSTRSSPSTLMRERMRSWASSTVITPSFYLAAGFCSPSGGEGYSAIRLLDFSRSRLLGLIEGGAVPGEEPAAAEREQPEEAGRNEKRTHAEREAPGLRERRKHQHDTLEEDADPSEEQNHHEDLVPRRRPAGQALEQIAEWDESAEDEDDEGQRPPRIHKEPREEELGLDGDIAVPDDQVLGEEEVHPHDAHGERQLGHVLDAGRGHIRHASGVGPDGQEGHQSEAGIEGGDHIVAAEEPAVPRRVDGHDEVEAPQREHHHVEDQHGG